MPTDATPSASPSSDAPSGSRQLKPDRSWHLFFGLLLLGSVVSFTLWAGGQISQSAHYTILVTTVVFGFFMAFNIGGNDVANSFGTSVGAGTLTMKQALLVAAIFEVGGAVLAGGEVTDTVRSGIVDLSGVALDPMGFAFIMMAALLGAAVWLLVATRLGLPVSTTHAIIGGIVGAAVTLGVVTGTGGWEMVQWDQIWQIVISWFLSPALGGVVAYFLFRAIKNGILVYNEKADAELLRIQQERVEHRNRHREAFERLDELQRLAYTTALVRDAAATRVGGFDPNELESDYFRELVDIENRAKGLNPYKALETWAPLVAAFGAMMITAMMLFKGLKNLELHIDNVGNFIIMGMIGAATWMTVYIFTKTLKKQSLSTSTFLLFSWMQVFTAAAFAFSHGANDIANAVGPLAAVLDVLNTGQINGTAHVPGAVMLATGIALVSGLWFIGRRVITTVGTGLTKMHPASGFTAELSAAAVVMGASLLGLPVSSTHILIGAVLGVGMVNKAANWNLMKPIALAWVVTIPAAAAIGAVGVVTLRAVFGG